MKILIACERSGVVREAFTRLGHEALSVDLEPSDLPGNHYQGSILDVIEQDWDMMIAFPPCTHLCVSGARWFKNKKQEQKEAIMFFLRLAYCHIPKIAIENPIGIMSTAYRKPDQIIQPWQFGHGETKATCLWIKGLPLLKPTNIVQGREARIHKMAPSKDRSYQRAKTYQGIADAMADQWGKNA